jgi:hypothetical protein
MGEVRGRYPETAVTGFAAIAFVHANANTRRGIRCASRLGANGLPIDAAPSSDHTLAGDAHAVERGGWPDGRDQAISGVGRKHIGLTLQAQARPVNSRLEIGACCRWLALASVIHAFVILCFFIILDFGTEIALWSWAHNSQLEA